jgi:hypothetical protein
MYRFSKSHLLIIVAIFFYGSAIVAMILADIPNWLSVMVVIFVVYNLLQVLLRYGFLRSPLSVLSLWQDSKGHWVCQTRSNKRYTGSLWRSRCFLSPIFTILWIKGAWGQKCLIIPFDALPNQQFRQLSYQAQI